MEKYTPMIKQYLEVKKGYQDALVFYRLGDFYEMFFDDAKIASSELDLVLTGRNGGVKDKIPMCGVPHHASKAYIQKLVERGYKVAIVEQLEDAGTSVGIVKRDVIQVITPGTIMDNFDDEKKSVFLASIIDCKTGYTLSIVELSTGVCILKKTDYNQQSLMQAILKNNIYEVVVKSDFNEAIIKKIRELDNVLISYCDSFDIIDNYLVLTQNITDQNDRDACGLMIHYLENTQKQMIGHLQVFEIENNEDVLYMDYSTSSNLELTTTLRSKSNSETLWSYMDKCQSVMGSRLLKQWIERPLSNKDKIIERLNQVEYLCNNFILRQDIKENLAGIYDIQRIVARIVMKRANAIDCIRLMKTLEKAPLILASLDNDLFSEYKLCDPLSDLYELLKDAFNENPPLGIKEGKMFKDGYDEVLDEARSIQKDGRSWILECEAKEREKTGIKSLKIGYNRVFGYYIEVTKGSINLVKDEFGYIRKQTLTNCERYITEELKNKEESILNAFDNAIKIEYELFLKLMNTISSYLPKIQKLANVLSKIDCLYAFSEIGSSFGYVRPEFSDGDVDIRDGYHPILNNKMDDKSFVSNDLIMDDTSEVLIITGPNMGGKSTYMRQTALIIVMAQMGSFVPCSYCSIPLFDKIFTRIGASDDIQSGKSTFMVEMSEANLALSYASKNSLILFDEIGRGTSTYDGMALAQAMIEYIVKAVHAKCLFSTHYHELTDLENELDGVKNIHAEVIEEDGHITFMYKMKDGRANRSYGINVANLAKLPHDIISRAKQLLMHFENNNDVFKVDSEVKMQREDPSEKEVISILSEINPNDITPIEAIGIINELKNKLVK
ncbi:MAG: DNA mismatch repair protein MutS [Anaerorhabdus sp.]